MPELETPVKKNWFIRHKVLTVILALVVIAIISSAGKGSSKSANTSSTSGSSASSASSNASSSLAKIGQAASDGKFAFTVNKITCGIPTVGANQYVQATAQGQFCDLNLTIKNTGTESQDLSDSNQFVFDASGKKYSASSDADVDASVGASGGTWFSSINPGNSVTGDMYFDVPKGITPVTTELHDSAFSGGVKVSLQ